MQTYQGTSEHKPRVQANVVADSASRARELLAERFPLIAADDWNIEILPNLQQEGVKEWTIL